MTAAISFKTCMVFAGVISFMFEDSSSFLISEMIFGAFVFLAYFWLVESKRDYFPSEIDKLDLSEPLEEDKKREQLKAQAEAELARKQAELQAQEEERVRRELEAAEKAKAEQEVEEARKLKEIEDARLQAEAEQAARVKEEEEAKERALEVERVQKEREEAARLQAEAEEAARLQAEVEEESRRKAEAEAQRKAEEEAARIQAQKEEERKLQQIEEARALAEIEQAARLQAEAESKAKAQEEERARLEAEEQQRRIAEEQLKEDAEVTEELTLVKASKSPARQPESGFVASTLESPFQGSVSFHGSMGYLAHTDAGINAELSMRVRVLNETTGRSQDVVVPVTKDLTIFQAIYSNLKVREAGVRKWPKELARAVKEKSSEVVCSLLDPSNSTIVMRAYSIADTKKTSIEAMHSLASPESDQTVRIMLKCQRIKDPEASDSSEMTPKIAEDLDASLSLDDFSFSNDEIESKSPVRSKGTVRLTPTAIAPVISEDDENDTADDDEALKAQNNGSSGSPKGNDSVDGDGAQSVSDGSTYSTKSIEEKRRRKRELEAKRHSISSPTNTLPSAGTNPVEEGGGFLRRFFSGAQNQASTQTKVN